jgi:hypothetical protein
MTRVPGSKNLKARAATSPHTPSFSAMFRLADSPPRAARIGQAGAGGRQKEVTPGGGRKALRARRREQAKSLVSKEILPEARAENGPTP